MLVLSVENLSHSYGARTLFSGVELNIESDDKIGVIGVNGTGKSTFLRRIAELDGGSEGSITTNGPCVIEYLPQDPPFDPEATVLEQIFKGDSPMVQLLRRYEDALEQVTESPENEAFQKKLLRLQQEMDDNFAWQLESEAKAVLTRLGITKFNQPMKELSGGQRKRVALAGVLVRPSDLLILDEPTNHMDNATVAWLEEKLLQRKGAVLMVTHDRYFFDRVVNKTVELDRGKAFVYIANYSGFLEKREERRREENQAAKKLANVYRRELAWIQRGAEARRTKKKDRVERFKDIQEEVLNRQEESNLEMASAATRLGKTVIELEHVGVTYSGTRYIDDFSYILLRNDRLGIVGPNGCGKSTLMDLIAGVFEPDEGEIKRGQTVKIGYFSQHNKFPDTDLRVVEYIKEAGNYVQTADGQTITAETMLERFLFPSELQGVPVSKLSGGEKRRLYLLGILMQAPNILILDEPTNDLDIPTLSVLEEYLDSFPGAVIAVSHDRYFLDRFAKRIFAFESGGVIKQYEGNYSDYVETVELEGSADNGKNGGSGGRAKNAKSGNAKNGNAKSGGAVEGSSAENAGAENADAADEKRGLTYGEKLELAAMDEKIAGKEAEMKMLNVEITMAGSDFTAIADLSKKLEKVQAEYDELMERWLDLESRA